MKKTIIAGLAAGIILLIFSVFGLYLTVWLFPNIAMQYFASTFNDQSSRIMLYYIHPFVVSFALSWFWNRFKKILRGSFISRGIEFGLIYVLIAKLPDLWLVYSAIDVSLAMVGTWLVFGLLQGIIAGLVFEKINS